MTEGVRSWLISVLTAGILGAVADAVMPEGSVKQVGRLTCGLVMICALLGPVSNPDLAVRPAETLWPVGTDELQLRQQTEQRMKTIIEEACAAYIQDKAAERGIACKAEVICAAGADGIFLPAQVRITGVTDPEDRAWIARTVREDLGVPEEGQQFSGEDKR